MLSSIVAVVGSSDAVVLTSCSKVPTSGRSNVLLTSFVLVGPSVVIMPSDLVIDGVVKNVFCLVALVVVVAPSLPLATGVVGSNSVLSWTASLVTHAARDINTTNSIVYRILTTHILVDNNW